MMLRLNVVCTEKEQRFMVLGRKEDTIDTLRDQAQTIFKELYPAETPVNIIGFQNEFHFDIPLHYKIGDALIDTGLVFAIEADLDFNKKSIINSDSGICFSDEENITDKMKITSPKRRKHDTKLKSHRKRKAARRIEANDSQSQVTSTCSSPHAEGSPLLPQRVESGDEDNEVDIETLQEENVKTSEKVKQRPAKQMEFVTSTPAIQTISSRKQKKLLKKKKKKYDTVA